MKIRSSLTVLSVSFALISCASVDKFTDYKRDLPGCDVSIFSSSPLHCRCPDFNQSCIYKEQLWSARGQDFMQLSPVINSKVRASYLNNKNTVCLTNETIVKELTNRVVEKLGQETNFGASIK